MKKLFLDMDGVLADFDGGIKYLTGKTPEQLDEDEMWKLVKQHPNFYETLLPMPDAMQLWNAAQPYKPTILTGVPSSRPLSAGEKKRWAERLFGKDVKIITCPSKDKRLYGKPGDVLVDDWDKYQHLWEKMGGIFILHKDAASTIPKVKEAMDG